MSGAVTNLNIFLLSNGQDYFVYMNLVIFLNALISEISMH